MDNDALTKELEQLRGRLIYLLNCLIQQSFLKIMITAMMMPLKQRPPQLKAFPPVEEKNSDTKNLRI